MRIASFDVGIRNLAYCVIDLSTNSIRIIDWNVASLLPGSSDSTQLTVVPCGCTVGTGKRAKLCAKPAAWKTPDNQSWFCGRHAKLATQPNINTNTHWLFPSKKHLASQITKLKMEEAPGTEDLNSYNFDSKY